MKEAVPELGIAVDVCVCAYTDHGQCVLFREGGADVAGTLERLGETQGNEYVVRARRLDGDLWEVEATPL